MNDQFTDSSTVPIKQNDYEDFLERFSDGVVAIDKNRRIISFSRGAERITGYRAEDVTGLTCEEVFKSDICEKKCIVKMVLKTGKTVSNFREDIKDIKGNTIAVSVNATALLDIHNDVVGVVLSFRNVLEVYRLTAELFKESIRLQSILSSIADGVFTVDSDWVITSFNPAAERITGYMKKDVLGKPCNFVFRSVVCDEDCPLRKTIRTGESISNFEMEIVNAKEERVPISVSTSLLIDEKGDIIGGVETFRDLSVLKHLTNELKGRYSFANIVGKNPNMQKIYDLIEAVSNTNSTVLILGETGTGKDLVARAIHYNSARRTRPFVKISCAALPETLLESELFGHKKGAFTGAVKDKPGRFSVADGGTVFLDEVGEIPVSIQAKLLRVLEEQEFEPLGSTRAVKVDVRIIAATNRNLEEAMKEGKFREDLFYRLNVVPIHLPSLRERKDDIPLIVEHLVKKFNQETGKHILSVSPKAMELLIDNNWGGNVRQLENAIEYAFIHCEGKTINEKHLPMEISRKRGRGEYQFQGGSLEEIEKNAIIEALKKYNNNRGKAANALGISRITLWRRMSKFDIEKKDKNRIT